MADPLTTPILRTAVNKPGTVYDAANTKRMFAEDWNAAGDALDNHEERIVDLEANPLATELGLGENAGLGLDNALSGDGKYSGIVYAGVAGATLAFGDLCYKDPTDGRWELADSDVITAADGDCRGILGICVLAADADGDATKMLLFGVVRAATFPAFTINAQLFVSGTAGDITETIPTGLDDAIRCVGYALSAEDLYFNPSPDTMTRIV